MEWWLKARPEIVSKISANTGDPRFGNPEAQRPELQPRSSPVRMGATQVMRFQLLCLFQFTLPLAGQTVLKPEGLLGKAAGCSQQRTPQDLSAKADLAWLLPHPPPRPRGRDASRAAGAGQGGGLRLFVL